MPVLNYTYAFKEEKSRDTVFEFVRLQNGFLFDEIAVSRINMVSDGHEFVIEYTRLGTTLKDLPPVYVSAVDFAAARAEAQGDRAKFASGTLVKRLFADGSRRWLEFHKSNDVDQLADADFIESMR
jgi:hypothetical protein